MSKSVTIDDIAYELKVSKSMVSRALSDKYGVSDEMRNHIKVAAMKMGYVFKSKKRAVSQKADSVTVIVEKFAFFDTGYWLRIIDSIKRELYNRKITVFISEMWSHNIDTLPIIIRQMKSSGIILLGRMPEQYIATIAATGLPVVLIDCMYSNIKLDHVMANNYQGAYEATEYIINSGHHNIAFVGSLDYSFSFKERHRGFCSCIEAHSSSNITAQMITESDNTNDISHELKQPFSVTQFMSVMSSEQQPTALLCANDPTAFTAYELLKSLNLRVPDDISIVGFDNVPQSELVTPALSTVNIPKDDFAEYAVDLLLKRVENPQRNTQLVMVSSNMVFRDSVKVITGNE